jgi:hypothetical protein
LLQFHRDRLRLTIACCARAKLWLPAQVETVLVLPALRSTPEQITQDGYRDDRDE